MRVVFFGKKDERTDFFKIARVEFEESIEIFLKELGEMVLRKYVGKMRREGGRGRRGDLGKKEPQVAPRTDTGKEARIHICVQGERGEDLKRKTCM